MQFVVKLFSRMKFFSPLKNKGKGIVHLFSLTKDSISCKRTTEIVLKNYFYLHGDKYLQLCQKITVPLSL